MSNLEPQSANLRLTKQRALVSLAAKIHNDRLKQAYDGRINRDRDNLEKDKQLKDILSIGENDTIPEINLKILTFYLIGDKISPMIEEYVAINEKYLDTDPSRAYGTLRFQPIEKYFNGKQTGYNSLKIPHIDHEKISNLRDISYTVGSITALYVFADKKQIKLYGSTKKDCHQIINILLSVCTDTFKLGSSEEHTYFGNIPNNIRKFRMHGVTVYSRFLTSYNNPILSITNGKIFL